MLTASTPPPTPIKPRRHWPIEVIAGLSVVIVAVVIGLVTRQHKLPTPTTKRPAIVITSTPLSYSSFIGQVTAVNDQLVTVLFSGTDPDGQPMEKTYQITVDSTTELKTIVTNGNNNTSDALPLTDLRPESTVLVASDDNIANTSAFTATKLFAYKK